MSSLLAFILYCILYDCSIYLECIILQLASSPFFDRNFCASCFLLDKSLIYLVFSLTILWAPYFYIDFPENSCYYQ